MSTWCKHYSGTRNDKCRVGKTYVELVEGGRSPGWIRRLPCFQESSTIETCGERVFPTPEEIELRKKGLRARLIYMGQALDEINAQHKSDGKFQGTIPCPECGGVLKYSIAQCNGHIWGYCTTKGCLSWMQ
jgi:hypothetical protein